jgi:hypothetical protein
MLMKSCNLILKWSNIPCYGIIRLIGRMESAYVPNHLFCNFLRHTTITYLRIVHGHADALVAEGCASRTGLGWNPAWEKATCYSHGLHGSWQFCRLLVPHSTLSRFEKSSLVWNDRAHSHDTNYFAHTSVHELVCKSFSLCVYFG